jgi:hypothetical protein
MLAIGKTAPTDRVRGGVQFVERRTNAWAALVGFLTGRGQSAPQIAEMLGDGTSAGTITKMWEVWGIRGRSPRTEAVVTIKLSPRQRSHVYQRACQHGITMEEYMRRILVHGSMPVDRYSEIVGD